MKTRLVLLVVVALALSACSASSTAVVVDAAQSSPVVPTTTPLATTTSATPTTTTPPALTTTTSHTPFWVNVKYRSDPVDVADPRFVYLDGGSSSLVDAAFYDAGNRYMIISLDGTAYHYCDMPQPTWAQFTVASSLGSFYRDRIKGSYDCRAGFIPQY